MAPENDRSVPPGMRDAKRRIITNKITGETVHVVKYGAETNGEFSAGDVTCLPGGGPPLHYHTSYRERFTAVEGDLIVKLDGDSLTLKPGESAEVPIGKIHTFTTPKDQQVRFKAEIMPAHAGFERFLHIMYGLANDGLAGADGLPTSFVHKALLTSMSDIRFAGPSGLLANTLIGVVAWYGRWSGEEERLLKRYWD